MGTDRLLTGGKREGHWDKDRLPAESPGLDVVFKALSDRTRRQILCLLHRRGCAVSEIVDHFHLTQPSISRHLGILRSAGLVRDERRGQKVIYNLGDPSMIKPAMHFLDAVRLDPDGAGRQRDARRAG